MLLRVLVSTRAPRVSTTCMSAVFSALVTPVSAKKYLWCSAVGLHVVAALELELRIGGTLLLETRRHVKANCGQVEFLLLRSAGRYCCGKFVPAVGRGHGRGWFSVSCDRESGSVHGRSGRPSSPSPSSGRPLVTIFFDLSGSAGYCVL